MIQSLTGLTTAAFGCFVTGKGFKNCKNGQKLLGIAKLALGATIVGAGYIYAVHETELESESFPPLLRCSFEDLNETNSFPKSFRSNCIKVIEMVEKILKNRDFYDSSDNFIPPILTKEMYKSENISCKLFPFSNDPRQYLSCNVLLTEESLDYNDFYKIDAWTYPKIARLDRNSQKILNSIGAVGLEINFVKPYSVVKHLFVLLVPDLKFYLQLIIMPLFLRQAWRDVERAGYD